VTRDQADRLAVVAANASKNVLGALWAWQSEEGPGVITGVDMRRAWGESLFVKVSIGRERPGAGTFDRTARETLGAAVRAALPAERLIVEVVERNC
jgi:hypothetical protein